MYNLNRYKYRLTKLLFIIFSLLFFIALCFGLLDHNQVIYTSITNIIKLYNGSIGFRSAFIFSCYALFFISSFFNQLSRHLIIFSFLLKVRREKELFIAFQFSSYYYYFAWIILCKGIDTDWLWKFVLFWLSCSIVVCCQSCFLNTELYCNM
jgi:hypothetical protein